MQLDIRSQLGDINACFPELPIKCIFDVGANIGQSAEVFHIKCPDAEVHCFEPTSESFAKLSEKFFSNPLFKLNNVGLSDAQVEVRFDASGTSTMNRMRSDGVGNVTVKLTTLDLYCKTHNIECIDYLKIDTEGSELKVLEGSLQHLQDIKFIEAEASLNPHNKYHNSFFDIYNKLTNNGFYLFGIYEQMREWSGGGVPIMRRSNPLFVNSKLIGALPQGVIRF
ncbi:FkbM family methyltransferase [Hydrogenophaga sp. PAMC20947]|uniref:FkbM family methyltransferase n=1 Tax=Hydrogenophaga sp. PAMC20947 TaxID=2565558 RepID=UPI00109DB428|nr:FkbM family methyltransferase [Hydrogenophaga sp. PAMC20947]QCB46334.1 FkbM family methyltransferase [Hydrogenophaga sp. PAMC20947]